MKEGDPKPKNNPLSIGRIFGLTHRLVAETAKLGAKGAGAAVSAGINAMKESPEAKAERLAREAEEMVHLSMYGMEIDAVPTGVTPTLITAPTDDQLRSFKGAFNYLKANARDRLNATSMASDAATFERTHWRRLRNIH